MEIPQRINQLIAQRACELGIPVFQDIGGEDREVSSAHLKCCTYVSPNLTELSRLTGLPVDSDEAVVRAAKTLQERGARNVLVTMGDRGSLLVAEDGDVVRQTCCPAERVADETGAGDNFRGAFVVSLFVDKRSVKQSLEYASAAGAVVVAKVGAIPACARIDEVEERLRLLRLRGGYFRDRADDDACPYEFASRLNSMKDRADLWEGEQNVNGWIARQGRVQGLSLVDFNYPQHITSRDVTPELTQELINTLHAHKLRCGAICLRFPKEMRLGAFTNPDPIIRQDAIQLTKEACAWAKALGSNEVVVWSAFDGYDYPLQVDYEKIWSDTVDAFREVCDAFPDVKISLEYKPTDENTRFFAVPSTGTAVLLMNEVNRDNFGLTIDFGHCLMAGENPAQSIATVPEGKLFGVQLGDGYGRLGAEDGLAFGSVHPRASLEFVLWLIKRKFSGHIYFDTFPRNEDPVREAEYNIRYFKRLYREAKRLLSSGKYDLRASIHDAMGSLEDMEAMSPPK